MTKAYMIEHPYWRFSAKISEVEVVEQTKCLITIKETGYDGKKRVNRYRKDAGHRAFFDTWQEAHNALLNLAHDAVESAQIDLDRAYEKLGEINGMKEPKQ